MKKTLLAIILLALTTPASAWTIQCKQSGKVQHCHSEFTHQHRASGTSERLQIRFLIRNGEVDTESVCHQYERSSLQSRHCLRKASDMFREVCQYESKQPDLSTQRKALYCDAARRFVPLR